MSRMTVPHQEYFVLMTMHQTFQKLTYLLRSHSTLNNHKLHLSTRCYGCHHIQPKTGTCTFNNGGFAFQGPSGSGMKVRPNSRLVLKVNRGAVPFLHVSGFLENLLFPLLDQFGVSLVRTVQWFLTGESELVQQPANRSQAELYTKLTLDQRSNHRTFPQSKGKFQLPRVLVTNGTVYPSDPSIAKFFRPAAATACSQALPSTSTIPGQPVVNAGTGETECFNNSFRVLSSLHLLNRSDTNLFHCFGTNFSSIKLFHERKYT